MEINNQNLEIMIYPERDGVLSPIGHDLAIEAQKLSGKLDGTALEITVPFDQLRVIGNISNGQLDRGQPGEKDRKKIEQNMLADVLETKKFSSATFSGTREGDVVSGELTLHGVTRGIRVALVDGRGSFVINQNDYKIKPFKAFLGQLRIKPELRIEVVVKGL